MKADRKKKITFRNLLLCGMPEAAWFLLGIAAAAGIAD